MPENVNVTAFVETVSPERFSPYLTQAADELDAVGLYLWNVALSEALYPALQAVEVALRNTLHTGLAAHWGSTTWFDGPNALQAGETQQIADVRQRYTNKAVHPTPGKIVADLSFGFWTSLLDARYEQTYWPALLPTLFPSVPRTQRTRRRISGLLTGVRRLRNRVFHHEPIWNRPYLLTQHTEMHLLLSWLSPSLATETIRHERFKVVHGEGHKQFVPGSQTAP